MMKEKDEQTNDMNFCPKTVLDLAERCLEAAEEHLAEESLRCFEAYRMGYDISRSAHGLPSLPLGYDTHTTEQAFRALIPSPESWPPNLKFESFLVLKCKTSRDAFSEWIRICRSCSSQEKMYDKVRFQTSVLQLLDLGIRQRPGLYFGNTSYVAGVWSLLSGYGWAERDLGILPGNEVKLFRGFQPWVEQRYPFGIGIPWWRIFWGVSLYSQDRALAYFFSAFDLYRSGKAPGTLGQLGSLVADSCLDASSEEGRAALRRIVPE